MDNPPPVPPSDWRDLLVRMLTIRFFEDNVQALFASGSVRGSTHLCQGQEAVTVGVCSALQPGDTMTCTYRGHGALIAMGANLEAAFAELLGRRGGLCGGKGGSMHFADLSIGALGSNAIVGAHLPITVGAAFAAQYTGSGAVSVAFTGDGSANIGAFHESLNMAAVWRLPAIFVIENNHYGEYSPLATTTPIERLAERASGYAMPGIYVDGNDVLAVREVAKRAVARARAGDGPTLIEADTYRQQGHSRSDPAKYRPEGELEYWLARDPVNKFEELIAAHGLATRPELEHLREEVRGKVREALGRARQSPEPSLDALLKDVFQ